MCDVHTVEQYEEYHAKEEPGGDTWRSKQLDVITFPPRVSLSNLIFLCHIVSQILCVFFCVLKRLSDRETEDEDSSTDGNPPVPRIYVQNRRVNIQHFDDDIWRRVMATDTLFKPLVTLYEEHWEALFKVLNVSFE